ncbi:MAG: MgtC/SapB family protein [Anaplasmataceae bacterium]|nr:MgtC/SapB family protein [Anaplasmataceae bacterium]
MLEISQILARLVVALVLGSLMGIERELAGKEAGVRTNMLVAGGSALFTMIALMLPFLTDTPESNLGVILERNSGALGVIANIVVGIGFLGAGIIIKNQSHVHGLTTAALVWTTSAIGIIVGVGLVLEATLATIIISGLLYSLRKLNLSPIRT